MIRIPAARGNQTCIEYRSPDPSCNPYLALAVMIEAGLDGIKNNLKSDEPMSAKDLSKAVHPFDFEHTLPKTLKDAVVELDKDELIKSVLGDVYENYKRAKINEWMDYISIVHDWEVERYISRY